MTFDPMSVEVTCVTLPKDHCVQVPWQYINVCGYSDQFCKLPHTYTTTYTYYVHTTYRMSDHIVSYWTQFRWDKSSYQDHWYNLVNRNDNMKKFWSFVKSTRTQPEILSFNINNNSAWILPKLLKNSMIFSWVFLHIMMILLKLHLQSLKVRIFASCRLALTWFLTEFFKIGADIKAVRLITYRVVC